MDKCAPMRKGNRILSQGRIAKVLNNSTKSATEILNGNVNGVKFSIII